MEEACELLRAAILAEDNLPFCREDDTKESEGIK